MIRLLADPANAITAGRLISSTLALYPALSGRPRFAVTLLLAGVRRLSYSSSFGLLADGRSTVAPLSYDAPLLTAAFLLRPWLANEAFAVAPNGTVLGLADLHVAPTRMPAPISAMYAAVVLFSVTASGLRAMRAWLRA